MEDLENRIEVLEILISDLRKTINDSEVRLRSQNCIMIGLMSVAMFSGIVGLIADLIAR